jgi:sarcosine oxidase subunit gamma
MAEMTVTRAFTGLENIGTGEGVYVRLRDDLSLISVLACRGKASAVIETARAAFDLALRDAPERACMGAISALGIGPGRWLFLRDGGQGDFAAAQERHFAGIASLSDHSDGYAVFEISGPAARHALAKGVPIDLECFGMADAAVTIIAHIGAVIWKSGENRFAVAVFRSYAGSFWHWLQASAAEFGLIVEDGA